MAKIFNTTAVDNIYQVDLVGADIPAPSAYPTYLFYNPYDEAKTVPFRDDLAKSANLRLNTGEYLLYDAVNKDVVARHVAANATITRPAGHRATASRVCARAACARYRIAWTR